MSLSAAAAATEEELKNFFPDSPFRKTQRMTMEEAEPTVLEHLKQVFSDPSPIKKASVNSETFGTLNCPAELAGMAPELAERLSSLQMKDLKRVFSEPTPFPPPAIPEEPSQLQVEETKEEEQRADELRHNVAVRRANLALQREMHPYVIRATAVKYLRLVVKLKNQIADEMKSSIALNEAISKEEELAGELCELIKTDDRFTQGVGKLLQEIGQEDAKLREEQAKIREALGDLFRIHESRTSQAAVPGYTTDRYTAKAIHVPKPPSSVDEPVPGVPELLKTNKSFVKGVEDTLNAMEKKLTLLIEEQNETLLPTPADLAAQVQQVLALLAETFEISQ